MKVNYKKPGVAYRHIKGFDVIPPEKRQIEWMVDHGYAKQATIMQMTGATKADFSDAINALTQREYLSGNLLEPFRKEED
jgi:hypothetical protein